MQKLTSNRLTRRLITTVALGSLGDWATFSALVLLVHRTAEGPVLPAFSVALVAAARLVPGVVVGPLVAPFAGAFGVRRTIVATLTVKAALVLGLAVVGDVWALAGLVALIELAGALGSATQEAAISREVDPELFPALNTATGALGYGMIPLGGLLAGPASGVSPAAPFLFNAAALLGAALLMARTPELDGATARGRRPGRSGALRPKTRALTGLRSVGAPGVLRDTLATAALGISAIVMLFSLGPSVASELLGPGAQHAHVVAVLAGGAAIGAVAAQRRIASATGLVLAAAGTVLLAGPRPAGVAGLLLIGAGAAVAYVDTQARIQLAASSPEEFAAGFAVMKSAAFVAMLLGPQLWLWGGLPLVASAMAGVTAGGALLGARRLERASLSAVVLCGLSRVVLGAACRIRVEGRLPQGAAVVVANHPSALDGVLGVWLDRRIRPVAKKDLWRHPVARMGLYVSRAIPTRSGTLDAAVAHLDAGGLVWIAPEGRINNQPYLSRPRSGAARMALAAGVPIVPMAIEGTGGLRLRAWRPWRRPAIRILIGDPQIVPPEADPEVVSHAFMRSLAAMLGRPYIGDLEPGAEQATVGVGAPVGRAGPARLSAASEPGL